MLGPCSEYWSTVRRRALIGSRALWALLMAALLVVVGLSVPKATAQTGGGSAQIIGFGNGSPVVVRNGATALINATLSPAPTAAGVIAVSSSNAGNVSVPAGIGFAAGQTSVAIPVTGEDEGLATVSVRLNGSVRSASVVVVDVPSRLVALQPTQTSIRQGATAQFTVSITPRKAGNDQSILLASSDPAIVSVPSSVVLLKGQSSVSFTATGVTTGRAQVTAQLANGGVTSNASAEIQVLPAQPRVIALAPPTSTLQKGGQSELRVTISSAQSSPTPIALSASTPGVISLPSTVTIPAGQTEAVFLISGSEVGSTLVTARVNIAGLNSPGVQAAVQVVPIPPRVATLEPSEATVNVSAQTQLAVRLNATQSTPTTVSLTTEPQGVAQVPATVVIPAGQLQASFGVTGVAAGQADVVASLNGQSRRATVTVTPEPPRVASMLPSALSIQAGASGTLTVRLNAGQTDAISVALMSADPAVARVPASVSIPAGALEGSFTVAGLAVGTTSVSASVNGTTATTVITVSTPPPTLSAVEPATQDLPKGKLGKFKVILDRAAQNPAVVTLTNSNAAAVQVPAQITVPAGQTTLDVPVIAQQLGESTVVATLNGTSQQTRVNVVEPEIVAITLTPATVSVGPGQTQQLQAIGVYTDSTTRDVTSGQGTAWSSEQPTIATVAPDGKVTGQQSGQTNIIALQSVLPTYGNPSPGPVTASAPVTVTAALPLAMAAGKTSLQVGETTTVSITIPYPVAGSAVTVNLSTGGSGALQSPATVSIPAGTTTANVSVRAAASGSPVLIATANQFAAAQLAFTVAVPPPVNVVIDSVTPLSAPPGAEVTLTGSGFVSPASANTVAFFGNVPAVVTSGSATQLVVRVPDAAQSGPITVTNSIGSGQSPSFTVIREQDFAILASPAQLRVMQGSDAVATLALSSNGQRPYQGLAKLTASGLPAGVTARFDPATMSAYQTGKLVLEAASNAPLAPFVVTIRAEATLDGMPWVRESRLNAEVITRAGVTGVKGRFITPEGNGISGVVARQENTTNQVVTDAAGNFLLAGLPAGQTTLRFDATPANSLYPIWPYTVTVQAGEVLTLADWVINPPPADDKFKQIANAAQDQSITDDRFPGFSLQLPAGVSIIGWDGVKKTRIAVEKIDPTKLPVSSPPFPMKEAYQLYFGTPMGGIPSAPLPVTLPNVAEREPGEKVEIWFFDGSPMGGTGEWKMAGLGTVSADGKTVTSDPGSGLTRFCGVCGLVSLSCPPPPKPPQPPPTCPAPSGGNPVDLFTGQEMATTGGLSCGGLSPVETGMRYNPVDAFNNRAGTLTSFGYGWTFDYDVSFLPFDGPQKRLVMPGGQLVNMVDDGTGKYWAVDDPRMAGMYAQSIGAGRWELVLRGGRTWQFEPFAGITGVIRGGPPLFLTKVTDGSGNVSTVTRQSNGRITSITGTDSRGMTLAYGPNGFVSRVTDHTGRKEDYEYTASNRVSKVTDALSRVTEYTYHTVPTYTNTYGGTSVQACSTDIPQDYQGLASIKYPESEQPTVNTYGTDRIVRQLTSTGQEWKFAYRRTGACVVKLLDSPRVTGTSNETFAFTCRAGQPLANRVCTGPNGTGQCTEQLVGICPEVDSDEARAQGWRFYGGTNTETRVTKPDGQSTVTRFNARGLPLEEVDETGQSTKYAYDAKQQLVRVTDPLGRETRFEYDSRGNQTAAVNPLGFRVETDYHTQFNKPTAIRQFLLGVPSNQGGQQLSYTTVAQNFTYDGKANITAVVDPTLMGSQIGYDAKGQISLVTLPALLTATSVPAMVDGQLANVPKAARKMGLTYSTAGDIRTVTDAQNNETTFLSDALGRTTKTTDPLGYTSTVQYNALDQVTTATNALSQQSSLTYDAAARLTGVVNPANVTIEKYGYDNFGRVNKVTDALERSSTVVYDESGRPKTVTDRKGQVTTFSYEARGLVSRIAKPGQTIDFSYDVVGRLTEVRDATSTTAYRRDAGDRVIEVATTTAAGTHRLAYEYDSLDRVTKRTLSGTGISSPEVTTFEWDLAGRILSHTSIVGGQPHRTNYEYDAAGRTAARKVQAGTVTDLVTQRYAYDTAERLAQIRYLRAGGTSQEQLIEQIDYGYDAKGQRTSKTALNNSGMGGAETPMTATYDAANRMTGVTLQVGGVSKSYALTYDDNGNLVQRQNTVDSADKVTYTWDSSDRLTGISQPDLNANFVYDAFGRRIQATITRAGQAPATVQYVYEAGQALGEIRDGKLSHRLLTELNLDETIARIALTASGQKDAANSRIYLTDALNSVIAQLTDDGAAVTTNSYGYSAYGETTVVGPDATKNPIQYTSRENDGTGLYFYRARYYDPVLKRFITEDPVGLAAGLNKYRYVDADPVVQTDPDGTLPIVPVGVAYLRCIAGCMAQDAAGEAVFGDIACFSASDSGKSCALSCLNPLNWASKGLSAAAKASKKSSVAANGARGRASEERVLTDLGLSKNRTAVSTAEGWSIPDALTKTSSVEVKDTAEVYLTKQLRIQTEAARSSGRDSTLITGDNTRVSGPASRAFDTIIRRPDLGPPR
jgi:RHS repeat-associated protein